MKIIISYIWLDKLVHTKGGLRVGGDVVQVAKRPQRRLVEYGTSPMSLSTDPEYPHAYDDEGKTKPRLNRAPGG